MGTKIKPGLYDCYANAEPDEPVFVLLARDSFAPMLVRLWAQMRHLVDPNSAKPCEAIDCAHAMEKWSCDHPDRGFKIPPPNKGKD